HRVHLQSRQLAPQLGEQGRADPGRPRRVHEHARALQVIGAVHARGQQEVALEQRPRFAKQPDDLLRRQLGGRRAHPWDRSTLVTTGSARRPATTRPRWSRSSTSMSRMISYRSGDLAPKRKSVMLPPWRPIAVDSEPRLPGWFRVMTCTRAIALLSVGPEFQARS